MVIKKISYIAACLEISANQSATEKTNANNIRRQSKLNKNLIKRQKEIKIYCNLKLTQTKICNNNSNKNEIQQNKGV